MEGVCEKVDDDRLTGHIEETDRRIDRITEELQDKTKVLELDLGRRVENTNSDLQSQTGINSGETADQYGCF
jgi:hypothetical protein